MQGRPRQGPNTISRLVSVVVPAFNEEGQIAITLKRVISYTLNQSDSLISEVIVVDDGSTDRTGEICENIAKGNDLIRVLHNGRNQGYAYSLRNGFKEAKGPLIALIDGDGQNDISDIGRMMCALNQGADIVVGRRQNRPDPITRRLISQIYNLVVRIVFSIRLHDVNGKPKLFRKNILADFNLTSESWFLDTELLVACKKSQYVIAEVPVSARMRISGLSKLSLTSCWRTFIEFLRFTLSGSRHKPKLNSN